MAPLWLHKSALVARALRLFALALLAAACSDDKPDTDTDEKRSYSEKHRAVVDEAEKNEAEESPAEREPVAEPTEKAPGETPRSPSPSHRRIKHAGGEVHAIEAGSRSGQSVLLLHGARFDASRWVELGTLDALASAGHRAVAIDLPGHGDSEKSKADAREFLAGLIPKLQIGKPVVVAPSMSGRYAYPLVESHPELVAGLVAVAPAGTVEHAPRLRELELPLLAVWGEKDDVFPAAQANRLIAAVSGARKVVLSGAGHACYIDRPDAFHAALLGFIRSMGN
ncbi:MAG: alpha/beta fold hydrolase [Polyangia bacterium]